MKRSLNEVHAKPRTKAVVKRYLLFSGLHEQHTRRATLSVGARSKCAQIAFIYYVHSCQHAPHNHVSVDLHSKGSSLNILPALLNTPQVAQQQYSYIHIKASRLYQVTLNYANSRIWGLRPHYVCPLGIGRFRSQLEGRNLM